MFGPIWAATHAVQAHRGLFLKAFLFWKTRRHSYCTQHSALNTLRQLTLSSAVCIDLEPLALNRRRTRIAEEYWCTASRESHGRLRYSRDLFPGCNLGLPDLMLRTETQGHMRGDASRHFLGLASRRRRGQVTYHTGGRCWRAGWCGAAAGSTMPSRWSGLPGPSQSPTQASSRSCGAGRRWPAQAGPEAMPVLGRCLFRRRRQWRRQRRRAMKRKVRRRRRSKVVR